MDNLRAAILRPQLADLPAQVARWAALHDAMERGARQSPRPPPDRPRSGAGPRRVILSVPPCPTRGMTSPNFVTRCAARGVELKWFGADRAVGFTSTYRNWGYADPPVLPQTDRVMAGLLDMRLAAHLQRGRLRHHCTDHRKRNLTQISPRKPTRFPNGPDFASKSDAENASFSACRRCIRNP